MENGKQIGRRPAARPPAECAGGQKRNRSRATRRTAGGLYLLVGRNGTKSWVYRYRQNGRLRDMGLGLLRLISLAEARERRRSGASYATKVAIRSRRGAPKKAEKRRAVAKTISFRQCAERYIAAHRVGWKNAKHAAQWPSPLAAYGYPIFGELAVQAVDVALVMKVLDPVWQKKPETVSRVRQRVESVRDWATAWKFRQRENPSRWRGHLENLLPSPREIPRSNTMPHCPTVRSARLWRHCGPSPVRRREPSSSSTSTGTPVSTTALLSAA